MKLNASEPEKVALPEWIRVLPTGWVELVDHREPFQVDTGSLTAMVAAFQSRGVDLVIDYEHQSLKGERAPAAGWIKDLEARDDGLWARVEWTPQAREHLERREYRYFSPVLRLDPETRRPMALMHLGLTNVPAINHAPPLVAKWDGRSGSQEETGKGQVCSQVREIGATKEKAVMMLQLKGVLGLDPVAAEEEVGRRVLDVFGEWAAALNLPGDAGVAQLQGALMAFKVTQERLRQVEEELDVLRSRLAEETAGRVVEEALQAGKVSPAQKGWALEYYHRDPDGFQAYVARAPKLVPTGKNLQFLGEARAAGGELLPEELALCRSLNLPPEEFVKAKARQT